MISVLALGVVDRMFDFHLVQHKDYDIGICCQQYDSKLQRNISVLPNFQIGTDVAVIMSNFD